MIREIKYVANRQVDFFTCHALFSHITNKKLETLNINAYSKSPVFKVFMEDRVITIILDTEDFEKLLKDSFEFSHKGKPLTLVLWSDNEILKEQNLFENDYVNAQGVISYSTKINNKNRCPVKFDGTFNENMKQDTLKYLSEKTGIKLDSSVTDQRDFRFEAISYKHFKTGNVHSKSNNNKLDFHNVFYFSIQGFIENPCKANMMKYTSIGKKRSFGFGNIDVSKI